MTLRRLLRGLVFGVVVLTSVGVSATAVAQECGSWRQPVLCEVRLELIDSEYQRVGLRDDSGIELAPRERVTLQLDARDQFGRRFPPERMALNVDARGCRSMLSLADEGEGSYAVTAAGAEGRCTVEVWVPNNLNFYWRLEFRINAAARRGYSRGEAELVARSLYAAILGREADDGGFRSAVAEVQAGNLEAQLDGMLRSAEFRQSVQGLSAADVLERFYQGLMGRETDSAGSRLYLGEMRRGQYASVLLKLIRSPEFERRLQR